MDCFSEIPGVEEGVNRSLVFSAINWLTKKKFEQLIDKNIELHPCINDNAPIDKKEYIGKTIPKLPPDSDLEIDNYPYEDFEIIGTVFKPNPKANNWKLKISHEGYVYELADNFLVLSIEDKDSYFWCSNKEENHNEEHSFVVNNKDIPRYALRAAVDKTDCKYSYIGRTFVEDSSNENESKPKRPKFYSNVWCSFSENMPQMFGKVSKNYKLLFAPFKNLEIGFDHFETLCLKASPASLKTLCRSSCRKYLNYSQKNIKSLYSIKWLPQVLVDWLKYPSSLKVGDFMLKDEKLVREDDKYELLIEKETGDLLIKCLDEGKERSFVIARNIDSIWLHRFHTVFYNHSNSTTFTAHSLYNNISAYKFFIDWDVQNSQIKQLAG